jgi:tetratricopeptide (TPR) repeat protein
MEIFWLVVVLGLAYWYFFRKKGNRSISNTADYNQAKPTPKLEISVDSTSERSERREARVHTYIRRDPTDGMDYVETDWNSQFAEIDKAIAECDYNFAREWLQRFAYTITGNDAIPELVKVRFKKVMTEFASQDPLYRQIMERVIPMVHAKPCLTQSEIYKGQPDNIKEQMRYVLYFAHELGHIRRVKKGSSYQLFPPEVREMYGSKFIETGRENGVVTYETLPKYAGGAGASITATIDEETSELNREATRLKNAGDWEGAIAALKKARHRTDSDDLRLPIFLQQAGKFDEAMTEFKLILSRVDEKYARDLSHQPEFIQKGQALHAKATIYDKMRLACKRQKLPDEASRYAAICEEYREKFDAYREIAEEYQRNKQRERKQSSKSGTN